ncbi:MAG: pilus assembly protein [Ilumatobacteraceae bacterium]|jgi:Flp pilus assembly protein TadG|nr:pilus assembly protein [Ilumatobacteraceae bacterium]
MRRDRGSAAVEMVLLTPLLVLLLLFVVHVGRAGDGMTAVRHAADQGARAASMVSSGRMADVARRAVEKDLARADHSCADPSVSVRTSVVGETTWVTVQVVCSTSFDGLSLLGAGGVRMSASSTEIVDRYRGGD